MKETNFDSPANEDQIEQQKAEEAKKNTAPEHVQLIDKTRKEVNTIHNARQIFERNWLVNIAFLYGKHYFSIEKNPKSGLEERIAWELKTLDRSKKTRRVVNRILPLYRSLLARMLMLKQRVTVDPLTNQERDIAAARVGQEVLEDFWQNVNTSNPVLKQQYAGMPQVLAKLFSYMLITGRGFLKPFYNPNAKAKVLFENLPKKPIITAAVGEVEVEVEHPFNIYLDPMGRYFIQKKILPTTYIEELYKKAVPKEDISLSDVEKQLINLLEGTTEEKFQDAAEVFERWEMPSVKYPDGRIFVCTKSVMLVEPQGIPAEYRSQMALFDFRFLDIMFAHPQGVIEQLIPSQEEYNHSVSRLYEYKKWMAGKILVPDGCKLSAKYDDQVGQVVKYDAAGGKPMFDNPPNPPGFIMQDLIRILRDMEDIAMTHDVSQGRTPSGVKSNIAIETLSELDQTQLSPVLLHIETQLSFFSDMVLDIVEAKYKESRLIGITGKHLAQDVRTFKGDNVAGNRRVKISLGSNLPVSRDARQAKIMEWMKAGIITKEEGREMMEFGSLEGVYHSIDDGAERTEIQEMLKGIQIIPQPWENHTRRIKILTDFMMGEDFVQILRAARDPNDPNSQQAQAIASAFLSHRKAHQEFLQQEMQAMRQATSPQPAPQPGAPA